jgi:hypothetical protein
MKSSFEPLTASAVDLLSDPAIGQLTEHGVENAWARLEVDLNVQLFFQRQTLVLSLEGLSLFEAGVPSQTRLAHWPLKAGLRLQHSDHSGAGSLELFDQDTLLSHLVHETVHRFRLHQVDGPLHERKLTPDISRLDPG